MSEATPRPWKWGDGWTNIDKAGRFYDEDVDLRAYFDKYADLQLTGADGTEVIPIKIDHYQPMYDGEPMKPADRALIVKAVNSFDALKAACELVVNMLDSDGRDSNSTLVESCRLALKIASENT